jgi:hypothetical protein
VEHALLFLKAPTNIEKKVRELQLRLYREWDLPSGLALPVMIPLCFVAPPDARRPVEMRELLRRSVGRRAPYLRTGSILEAEGFLFWELGPREDLRRLEGGCARAFAGSGAGEPDRRQAEQQAPRPDRERDLEPPEGELSVREPPVRQALFPTGRGFYLGSAEGRSRSVEPALEAPEPLLFPAKEAVLLRFRPLGEGGWTGEQGAVEGGAEGQPAAAPSWRWWHSLYWEELERIPLRKTGRKPNKP